MLRNVNNNNNNNTTTTTTTTTPSANSSQSTLINQEQQQQQQHHRQQQHQHQHHHHQSMNGGSPTNNNHSSSTDPPRKRSKVSRACDPCRKKKIKCNAEYSELEKKVTKICTSCAKNKEVCTFDRTPLKRGPSKGYIRDLEEKAGDRISLSTSSSSKSNHIISTKTNIPFPPSHQHPQHPQQSPSIAIIPPNPSINQYPPGNTQQLPFPQNSTSHRVTGSISNPSNSNNSGNSPTIKLPPIVNYPSKNLPSPLLSKFNSSISASQTSNPSSPKSQLSNIPGLLNNDNNNINNNNTPNNVGGSEKTNSPPIQGPFWKVPYEMPQSSLSRRSSIGSITSTNGAGGGGGLVGQPIVLRRPSVESISSVSTNGSRLPSIRPSISNDYTSDAESEDFYSVQSFRPRSLSRNSQSLSPRNSISSMSSLNGRINKSLGFNSSPMIGSPSQQQVLPPQVQQQQQQQPIMTNFIPPQAPVFASFGGTMPNHNHNHNHNHIPLNPLDVNLKLYYEKFHMIFPILPNDSRIIYNILNNKSQPPWDWLIEVFNHSLNNLINFQQVGLQSSIGIFIRLIQSYPFPSETTTTTTIVNDNSLILFFSSLIILSYTNLINGDQYNPGISFISSIFNDYKICERFIDYVNKKKNNTSDGDGDNNVDDDDVVIKYFIKLYYCLNLIDNLNSLTLGTNKNLNVNYQIIKFLNNHKDKFLQNKSTNINNNDDGYGMMMMINNSILNHCEIFDQLVEMRNKFIFINDPNTNTNIDIDEIINIDSISSTSIFNNNNNNNNDQFLKYFHQLIIDKYKIFKIIFQFISKSINSTINGSIINNSIEIKQFNQELFNLIKSSNDNILNFANFISSNNNSNTTTSSSSSSSSKITNTNFSWLIINNNPILNLSICQLFKSIKLHKLIIDQLVLLLSFFGSFNIELEKLNNQLSISFNLLNLNLQNLKLGNMINHNLKIKFNQLYKFQFNNNNNSNNSNNSNNKTSNNEENEENEDIDMDIDKDKLNQWYDELNHVIVPFIIQDFKDGWI